MLSNFTLGQYFTADSFIHRLDPRFKLTELIVFYVFVFIADSFLSIALLCLFLLLIIALSKVPLKLYLKNLKIILPIVIITALLNAFYVSDGRVLFSWWIVSVSTGGLIRAALMSARILLLILFSAVLTYTTTPTALTDAIESLLSPLKFIGLGEAVHTLAMMMTITLRFIPSLTEETDKIISAQKARGADFESGGLITKVKAFLPVLIPLFLSSVRRAYELATAMECRCYTGGKGRTRMKKLHATKYDYVTAGVCIIISALIIVLKN